MVHVLDSSVLIALMREETDGERLLQYFDNAVMGALNHSEVLQKIAQLGGSIDDAEAMLSMLGIRVAPFGQELSRETAALWPLTRAHGLSLADRSCLALAGTLGGTAVTADRAWGEVEVPGVTVEVIAR